MSNNTQKFTHEQLINSIRASYLYRGEVNPLAIQTQSPYPYMVTKRIIAEEISRIDKANQRDVDFYSELIA